MHVYGWYKDAFARQLVKCFLNSGYVRYDCLREKDRNANLLLHRLHGRYCPSLAHCHAFMNKSRRTTAEVSGGLGNGVSGGGKPLGSGRKDSRESGSSSIIPQSVEELRSAHIRTLEAMGHMKRENTELQKRVQELEKLTKGNERMKPEELDSLYVEERRLIESLEKENKALKLAAAGARSGRDSDAAAAVAETKRLTALVDELRDNLRRSGRLAAEQVEQVRSAYLAYLPRPPSPSLTIHGHFAGAECVQEGAGGAGVRMRGNARARDGGRDGRWRRALPWRQSGAQACGGTEAAGDRDCAGAEQ